MGSKLTFSYTSLTPKSGIFLALPSKADEPIKTFPQGSPGMGLAVAQCCKAPLPLPWATEMEGREEEDDLFYRGLQGDFVPGRKSTLVDDFERLTFEIQLNQAILRRSYSSPTAGQQPEMPPPARKRRSRLARTIRKLLKPIYGVGLVPKKKPPAAPPRGARALRTFSRSCRV